MEQSKIINMVDHTLLKQTSTWEQIKLLCDQGMDKNAASVCIPPYFVKAAKEYTEGKLPICTVIGFPARKYYRILSIRKSLEVRGKSKENKKGEKQWNRAK